ncbi:hypothetical protein VPHK479_0063 [Vibrio phage K479]
MRQRLAISLAGFPSTRVAILVKADDKYVTDLQT